MARGFNGKSTFYECSAPVTTGPVTISCWVRPRDLYVSSQGLQCLVAVGLSTGTRRTQLDIIGGDSNNLIIPRYVVITTANSMIGATSKTRASVINDFHHYCGTWDNTVNAGSVKYYFDSSVFNGGAGAAGTSTGWDKLTIGARYNNNIIGAWFSGLIAEVAVWNVVLDSFEVTALSRGVNPLNIRLPALKFYAPLIGNREQEIDIIGGKVLTLTP